MSSKNLLQQLVQNSSQIISKPSAVLEVRLISIPTEIQKKIEENLQKAQQKDDQKGRTS